MFWIILNCLLYIKQCLILLIIPENLRNLLVKNTFPLNNFVGGQVRNAVSYFLWILTNKSFNAKALPNKCNIIAKCILLLSTNKIENALEKLAIDPNCPKSSKSITEKFCFKLLSTGEEESEEWRSTYIAGRGKDRLLWQLMDRCLLKRKAYFG